jgi:hypothetical protein
MDTLKRPQKKVYTTPSLTIYGGVEVITQGNTGGEFTDAAFPVNTPLSKITTS